MAKVAFIRTECVRSKWSVITQRTVDKKTFTVELPVGGLDCFKREMPTRPLINCHLLPLIMMRVLKVM